MNLVETHDLLTLAAKYDNRRFDDATVVAWREVLADLSFEDCRAAVVAHFANSTEYLMPVHVRRGAYEVYRGRRRLEREAREESERLALEAGSRERSEETHALIAELRDRLPDPGPDILRRAEWVEHDKRREREANAEPNPDFAAYPPPDGAA